MHFLATMEKNNLPQERKGLFIKLAKSLARYFSRQQKERVGMLRNSVWMKTRKIITVPINSKTQSV
jgi:hypothetical protein